MLAAVFKSGHSGATYGGVATIDAALWDIKAKLAGEPLWRLLGGRDRFVPAYASGLDIALERRGDRGVLRRRSPTAATSPASSRAASIRMPTSGGCGCSRRPLPQHLAARADARRERVVAGQAGRALRQRARGARRPALGRGAAAPLGRRRARPAERRHPIRRRDGREPDGRRAVPPALRRRRARHRAGRRDLGRHAHAPPRDRRRRARPADQPGGLQRQPRGRGTP